MEDGEGRDEPKTTTSTATTNAPTTTTTTPRTTTVTTTTTVSSTTISTTSDPLTSSVFARCDGDCPSFPVYKYRVVSDEDDAEASYSSTVFRAPVTTSTPPLPSSTLTPTNSETTAPELSTTLATETI